MQVEDTYAEETITLDPEKVGLLMVYRPYQRLSYAVVLSASQSIEAGDLLKSP